MDASRPFRAKDPCRENPPAVRQRPLAPRAKDVEGILVEIGDIRVLMKERHRARLQVVLPEPCQVDKQETRTKVVLWHKRDVVRPIPWPQRQRGVAVNRALQGNVRVATFEEFERVIHEKRIAIRVDAPILLRQKAGQHKARVDRPVGSLPSTQGIEARHVDGVTHQMGRSGQCGLEAFDEGVPGVIGDAAVKDVDDEVIGSAGLGVGRAGGHRDIADVVRVRGIDQVEFVVWGGHGGSLLWQVYHSGACQRKLTIRPQACPGMFWGLGTMRQRANARHPGLSVRPIWHK